jgi:predicted Ser/Thr protein kinase
MKSSEISSFEQFKEKKNLVKFAEGYRADIYLYEENGKKFAVKTVDEPKLLKALQKEIEILKELKRLKIKFVPQIIYWGKDFFVYPFIEGIPFKKVQKQLDEKSLKRILKKLLIAAYCLDKHGIFKNEFQRPFTNVLVKDHRIYLIDFERGALNKFWKNVPQYLQFLMGIGILTKEETINFGRNYKSKPKKIIKTLLRKIDETNLLSLS